MATTHGGRRAGAGRPPTDRRYVRRLISLDPNVDAELSRLMHRHSLPRSQMIARLIEFVRTVDLVAGK